MASSRILERWKVSPQLSQQQFKAARQAGIEPVQAQLLYNRGMQTWQEMQAFLRASYEETRDPLTLIDMPRAVERILRALEQHEHITVYGDYDADGVTSSSLLYRVLRSLKHPDAPLDYHIPHRLHDGCGLNLPALDRLKAGGTQLIITTDCASSDVVQVDYASSLGMDVIITDHHHPPAELPRAYAMINPWRPDCTYGERYLCGVGIAFKLAQALYRAYKRTQEDELALLDLVAIGTIADIAPLLGENHTLVRLGMEQLNATQKPGLQALIHSANLQPGRIRERDISFCLAPRINAAGRMKDASIAFELLVTDSKEEAAACVAELEQLNLTRQQQTEALMRNVREQAQLQPARPIVLVNGDDWHEGIIGLVAGKLAEEIDKPVLVLSNDRKTRLSRGSARSRKGFNIIEALRGFASQLERYGGHSQAAGFTIRSERIQDLYDHLLKWQQSGSTALPAIIEGTTIPDETGVVIENEQENSSQPPQQVVDIQFTRLERINYKLYRSIRQLGPFGAGNPEPVFKIDGLRLVNTWPSGPNRQNLRLRLAAPTGNGLQHYGTWTHGAEHRTLFDGVSHVNIIFRLESSENETNPELWLKILDIEPAEAQTVPHESP
ncbi:MAG: single-stranded-DNA-specific exonuclease RecJ [Ktedonobacteraceae bacterium]|nr:single-stranded-DNA-specific exonuclease RecJ [Ktedonobacteraceae bacterium]